MVDTESGIIYDVDDRIVLDTIINIPEATSNDLSSWCVDTNNPTIYYMGMADNHIRTFNIVTREVSEPIITWTRSIDGIALTDRFIFATSKRDTTKIVWWDRENFTRTGELTVSGTTDTSASRVLGMTIDASGSKLIVSNMESNIAVFDIGGTNTPTLSNRVDIGDSTPSTRVVPPIYPRIVDRETRIVYNIVETESTTTMPGTTSIPPRVIDRGSRILYNLDGSTATNSGLTLPATLGTTIRAMSLDGGDSDIIWVGTNTNNIYSYTISTNTLSPATPTRGAGGEVVTPEGLVVSDKFIYMLIPNGDIFFYPKNNITGNATLLVNIGVGGGDPNRGLTITANGKLVALARDNIITYALNEGGSTPTATEERRHTLTSARQGRAIFQEDGNANAPLVIMRGGLSTDRASAVRVTNWDTANPTYGDFSYTGIPSSAVLLGATSGRASGTIPVVTTTISAEASGVTLPADLGNSIRALAFDPRDNNKLYVATRVAVFEYNIANQELSLNLPNRPLTNIEGLAVSNNNVYILSGDMWRMPKTGDSNRELTDTGVDVGITPETGATITRNNKFIVLDNLELKIYSFRDTPGASDFTLDNTITLTPQQTGRAIYQDITDDSLVIVRGGVAGTNPNQVVRVTNWEDDDNRVFEDVVIGGIPNTAVILGGSSGIPGATVTDVVEIGSPSSMAIDRDDNKLLLFYNNSNEVVEISSWDNVAEIGYERAVYSRMPRGTISAASIGAEARAEIPAVLQTQPIVGQPIPGTPEIPGTPGVPAIPEVPASPPSIVDKAGGIIYNISGPAVTQTITLPSGTFTNNINAMVRDAIDRSIYWVAGGGIVRRYATSESNYTNISNYVTGSGYNFQGLAVTENFVYLLDTAGGVVRYIPRDAEFGVTPLNVGSITIPVSGDLTFGMANLQNNRIAIMTGRNITVYNVNEVGGVPELSVYRSWVQGQGEVGRSIYQETNGDIILLSGQQDSPSNYRRAFRISGWDADSGRTSTIFNLTGAPTTALFLGASSGLPVIPAVPEVPAVPPVPAGPDTPATDVDNDVLLRVPTGEAPNQYFLGRIYEEDTLVNSYTDFTNKIATNEDGFDFYLLGNKVIEPDFINGGLTDLYIDDNPTITFSGNTIRIADRTLADIDYIEAFDQVITDRVEAFKRLRVSSVITRDDRTNVIAVNDNERAYLDFPDLMSAEERAKAFELNARYINYISGGSAERQYSYIISNGKLNIPNSTYNEEDNGDLFRESFNAFQV